MTETDHFELFGLERRWRVDRDAVERRYLELSQQHHHDHAVGQSTAAQRAAMEQSSRINAAYRVLRDPVQRAEYLIKLGGVDLDSSDPQTGAPHPTQEFLIEMIDLRERLADGQAEQLRDDVEARADAALDAAIAALDRGEVRPAAEQLVARRYFQRFLDEVNAS
jgi:molecular chaperone HscB